MHSPGSSPLPRSPFYERRGSERAADVEALTFMVAKAWAGVKRIPRLPTAPLNSYTHTHTHPAATATVSVALMNRLMTGDDTFACPFSNQQPPKCFNIHPERGNVFLHRHSSGTNTATKCTFEVYVVILRSLSFQRAVRFVYFLELNPVLLNFLSRKQSLVAVTHSQPTPVTVLTCHHLNPHSKDIFFPYCF